MDKSIKSNIITNPILTGFNPDPSIIRVKDDYYIATSTFEWFPGVQIHHSKDLINWKLITRPLNRVSQLDMAGIQSSGGIWAPCLSYHKGVFYLVYTIQRSTKAACMDAENYVVTASEIDGQWSEPTYLHSMGFDPSLFHDDDGKKWLVWVLWDHRKNKDWFGGIFLQEYHNDKKELLGNPKRIFMGTERGATEGPHLYKKDGWYYLMTAEGGTSYNHAVTLARSKNIEGPYEIHPRNPVLSSAEDENITIQKAGHASLVETQNGRWYLAHLCGRPLTTRGACVLGRETSLQEVVWKEDEWLYMKNGTQLPDDKVESPFYSIEKPKPIVFKDDFDDDKLLIDYQSLRVPLDDEMYSLSERKGYLRLYGKQSIFSFYKNSFLARRQKSFVYEAITCIEYEPENIHQMAGLSCWYNSNNFYFLKITADEEGNKLLGISICENTGKWQEPLGDGVSLPKNTKVYLKVKVNREDLQFYYSLDGEKYIPVGDIYDISILSDEKVLGWSFTGAFVGISCHDMTGKSLHADFDYFEYIEKGDYY